MKTSQSAGLDPAPAGLVFVVDDNPMLVEFASAVLESAGYKVLQFSDPKEALRAIREANPKPAVLVTDYEMGEMTGLQLIQFSHEIHPALKTLMLSGTVDASIIVTKVAEVHRFLGKPYQAAELQKAVAELMKM